MKQLVILKLNDKLISSFLENDELTEVFIDHVNKPSVLGNIYLGKVKNVIQNIEAAFVEIGAGKLCYLPLTEGLQKIGDEIIVQVIKDNVKSKKATVSTKLTFTGRFVVLVKGQGGFSVSSKILEIDEWERLHLLKDRMNVEGYKVILRTNSTEVSNDVIWEEFSCLKKICEKVEKFGHQRTSHSLLYENMCPYLTYLRDTKAGSLNRIITDDKDIYEEIKAYMETNQKNEVRKLEFYHDESYSLNHLLGIESKLEKALSKKVWLKSGGSIVIEPTEALTVIDVNTEKSVKGNRKPETTFFKINMEAAKEIARQLRVRNLSGIIIVDFIDMKEEKHREELLIELRKELKEDKVKTLLIDMTPLGLVEITRMKEKKPLHEQIRVFI